MSMTLGVKSATEAALSRPSGHARVQAADSDLWVTKEQDISSPRLALAYTSCEQFTTAILTIESNAGELVRYVMRDLTVWGIRPVDSDNGKLLESITFKFESIEWRTHSQQ